MNEGLNHPDLSNIYVDKHVGKKAKNTSPSKHDYRFPSISDYNALPSNATERKNMKSIRFEMVLVHEAFQYLLRRNQKLHD